MMDKALWAAGIMGFSLSVIAASAQSTDPENAKSITAVMGGVTSTLLLMNLINSLRAQS